MKHVLVIAGSDSSGGAGLTRDVETLTHFGVGALCALTAVTAQSDAAVTAVEVIPAGVVRAQIDAALASGRVDAVKIGMLGDVRTIEAVSASLDLLEGVPVVLDPVMVAESGAVLLDPAAVDALRRLITRATAITPNIREARALTGVDESVQPVELAREVYRLGASFVVVTGGHAPDGADIFCDGEREVRIVGEQHPAGAAHGSGCTHSSVLAAELARRAAPLNAARRARELASEAVRDGLGDLGAGAGPVDVLGLSRPV